MLGIGTLIAIPSDVVGSLRALPRLFAQIEAIATHTAQVAEATRPLPSVADDTTVLPPMYERMTGIESAMPTLVEVQQQLADLPATMDELQARIGGLSEMLERLLASLDTLDTNVAALSEAVQPIGRIADRLPGRR